MSSMNLFHHATQIKYELNSEKQGFERFRHFRFAA